MIKHAHKAMETNTTGGNDLHVPRNRSGIVLRYSTTLRRVEVVFPPRLQSTCVAHDGIEDQSARTYITTIRQANTLRNFVRNDPRKAVAAGPGADGILLGESMASGRRR